MDPDLQSTTNYNTFRYNSNEWNKRKLKEGCANLLGIVVFISIVLLSMGWICYISHIRPNHPNHWLEADEQYHSMER